MSYLQARSGIARSGVTYAGWTPPTLKVTIAGTDRTSHVLYDNWQITERLDGTAPTFRFTLKTLTPTVGQDIKILYATPNDYLFAGTILQAEMQPRGAGAAFNTWQCTAVGYLWLLDSYAPVLRRYDLTAVNTMVADLIYRFSDPAHGFRVGYVPSSLGSLDMDFTYETLSGALNRIAKAVGGYFRISPDKVIDLYVTSPDAALPTIGNATAIKDVRFADDLSQLRSNTIYEGGGSNATVSVSPGATSIPVDECSWYDLSRVGLSTGTVRAGFNVVTYTGATMTSGPGEITGCSGIVQDIAQGDAVNVLVAYADSAAETTIGTLLGGGASGQVGHYLQDGRLSLSECLSRATSDVATFNRSVGTFEYTTQINAHRVGRSVTVAITDPLTVSDTFEIQAVTITPRGVIAGTSVELWRQVSASRYMRYLSSLLQQLPG